MAAVVWKSWRGNEVLKSAQQAAANELNAAASDGVTVVQRISPRDTGFMANTMEQIDEATVDNKTASWGNVTAEYTFWVEIGARGRPGRHMLMQSLQEISQQFPKRLQGKLK